MKPSYHIGEVRLLVILGLLVKRVITGLRELASYGTLILMVPLQHQNLSDFKMKLGTNPHLPGPGDFGGYTDGGPNPDYDDRFDAQEAELETLRQEVLTLNRVFLETAKEIGCDADNEIILEAIHNLRQSLAAETSRADMAWENTRIIDKARIAEMNQRDELTKQLAECQALLSDSPEYKP